MEAQNSSYKLDPKSLQHYQRLKQQEADDERVQKDREFHELSKFRIKKSQEFSVNKSARPVLKFGDQKKKQVIRRRLERVNPSIPLETSEYNENKHELKSDPEGVKDHQTSIDASETAKQPEKDLSKALISGYSSESSEPTD